MFLAKDIMTKDVLTVTENTPLIDALSILVGCKITGVPVINDKRELIGIVSEKDLLKLCIAKCPEEEWVSDHMTRGVACFDENDSVYKIAKCLAENPFRRVPILSNGKLVGIISRRDLLEFILKTRKENENFLEDFKKE